MSRGRTPRVSSDEHHLLRRALRYRRFRGLGDVIECLELVQLRIQVCLVLRGLGLARRASSSCRLTFVERSPELVEESRDS